MAIDDPITLNKGEWEAFLRDTERLTHEYDSLHLELKEVNESKKELEQRLQQALKIPQAIEREEKSAPAALDDRKTLINDTEGKMLIDGTERVRRLRSRVRRLSQIELPE